MIIHSLQHLHGGVTSLTTPDLPGELPPALRRERPTFQKWDLVSHSIPHGPAVTSSPLCTGTRRAHPIPATSARQSSGAGACRNSENSGAEPGSAEPALQRLCVHSEPALWKRPKQAPSEDEQADGLDSHPAGVRLIPSSSPLPSPVAHRTRVTPHGKQGIFLPCQSWLHIQVVE